MADAASSIQGVFGLAAIIVGACSGALKRAAMWGAIVGCLPAAILIAVVVSTGAQNLDTPRFSGYLIGMVVMAAVLALAGYGIKRIFRRKNSAAAPTA